MELLARRQELVIWTAWFKISQSEVDEQLATIKANIDEGEDIKGSNEDI